MKDQSGVFSKVWTMNRPEQNTLIERAVMEEIGGGCYTPLGIYCHEGYLITEVLSLDGDRVFRLEREITEIEDARTFGSDIRNGASDLIGRSI